MPAKEKVYRNGTGPHSGPGTGLNPASMGDEMPGKENRQLKPDETAPGLGDIMVQAGGKNPNLLMELITTSTQPEHFIPQAFLKDGELKRDMRLMRQRNSWLGGNSNVDQLMWVNYAGSLAVDGRARNHLTGLMGGGRIQSFFKGLWDKGGKNPDGPGGGSQQANMERR